jgi:hypothetical protein
MRRASVPNGSLMWGPGGTDGTGIGPKIHESGCRVEEGPHQCHVRRPGGFRVPVRKLIGRDVLGLRPCRDLRLDGEAGPGPFAQVQVNDSLTFDLADEPEPCGGPVSTEDGPEPSLRVPRQRGGVRGDLRPRDPVRKRSVQPHQRADLGLLLVKRRGQVMVFEGLSVRGTTNLPRGCAFYLLRPPRRR